MSAPSKEALDLAKKIHELRFRNIHNVLGPGNLEAIAFIHDPEETKIIDEALTDLRQQLERARQEIADLEKEIVALGGIARD